MVATHHVYQCPHLRFICRVLQLRYIIFSHHFIDTYAYISLVQTSTLKLTCWIDYDSSVSSISIWEVNKSFMFASVFFLLATVSSGSQTTRPCQTVYSTGPMSLDATCVWLKTGSAVYKLKKTNSIEIWEKTSSSHLPFQHQRELVFIHIQPFWFFVA